MSDLLALHRASMAALREALTCTADTDAWLVACERLGAAEADFQAASTRAPTADPGFVCVPRSLLKPFAEIALLQDDDHRPGLPDMIDAPDLCITPNQVRALRAALAASPSDAAPTAAAIEDAEVGKLYAEADAAMTAYQNWLEETGREGSDDLRDAFLWGRASTHGAPHRPTEE